MGIRSNVIIEGDVKYGHNLDTGYFVVLRQCTIGNDVSIWSHCTIDPDAVIGDGTKLHNHVYVSQGTKIGNDVFIGPGVMFLNDKYPPRYESEMWEPPVVHNGAIIGGGVVVCPGVVIGERAIIAAGAVVTRNVPSRQLWGGVPATPMKVRSRRK